jgi:hypothetical protein
MGNVALCVKGKRAHYVIVDYLAYRKFLRQKGNDEEPSSILKKSNSADGWVRKYDKKLAALS